jgi:hypothetical protein
MQTFGFSIKNESVDANLIDLGDIILIIPFLDIIFYNFI